MLVVWILFELNALGVIGGLKPGGTNIIYDTHKNTLITGFVYAAFVIVVYAVVLAYCRSQARRAGYAGSRPTIETNETISPG